MNPVRDNQAEYYARRATTLDDIYLKPERQDDLAQLRTLVRDSLRGQRVLEIACGTGYWTREFANEAQQVLATDLNQSMLDQAAARGLAPERVRFQLGDAFALQTGESFNACFAGFFWSHVKRNEQPALLDSLRKVVGRDALLVMIDNSYVEGSSTPIARTDADGNTYQIRTLENGDRFEIVKNFPTDSGLRKRLSGSLKELRITRLQHYWMLTGRFK